MKSYGQGQYTKALKAVETDITDISKCVNELAGIKEPGTGLAPPAALLDLDGSLSSLHRWPGVLRSSMLTQILLSNYILRLNEICIFIFQGTLSM